MRTIDLNCDIGESFGVWPMGQDGLLMDYITSANIACGFHAGDADTMQQTVHLAIQKNVAIGAHPGFPDLQGFGRRNMTLSPKEVYNLVLYQIGALAGFVQVAGGKLHHVKPHGALYNMAATDAALSQAISHAIKDFDSQLIVYGLSGSFLISEAQKLHLRTASEVFSDRTYQSDGTLTPRNQPNALIQTKSEAVSQVMTMVQTGNVPTITGQTASIQADTICIHGDGTHALDFAKTLHQTLITNGISIKTIE